MTQQYRIVFTICARRLTLDTATLARFGTRLCILERFVRADSRWSPDGVQLEAYCTEQHCFCAGKSDTDRRNGSALLW